MKKRGGKGLFIEMKTDGFQNSVRYLPGDTGKELAAMRRLKGVECDSRNDGEYFILSVPTEAGRVRVYFYPVTGLWTPFGSGIRGRGIEALKEFYKLSERSG